MTNDERYIRLALQLAEQGRKTTSPNPMVGAVVVKGNRILAEGYHRKFGGPHAEAVALRNCGEKAKGATLYVNLEPCGHYGKTPPCTDLIIQSGIKRVVCSIIDPNPIVNGKGIKRLRKAGIEVSVGYLEQEAKKLNEVYFKYITTQLPFVMLRVVGSLNGTIIHPGKLPKLQWQMISSACENSVPAGIDAVLWDTKLMNNYDCAHTDSLKPKLILTGTWKDILGKLKTMKAMGHTNIVLVPIDLKNDGKKVRSKYKIWKMKKRKDGELDLLWLLKKAGEESIYSLLAEGGNKISTSLLQQKSAGSIGLVDKIWYQIFPGTISEGEEPFGDLGIKRISDAVTLKDCEFKQFQKSLLVVGYPV